MNKDDYRAKPMKDLKKSVKEIAALLGPEISKAMEGTKNKHKLEALDMMNGSIELFNEASVDAYRVPAEINDKLTILFGILGKNSAKIEKSFNESLMKADKDKNNKLMKMLDELDKATKKSGIEENILHRDENATSKEGVLLDGKTVGDAVEKLEGLLQSAATLTEPKTISVVPGKDFVVELTPETQRKVNLLMGAASQDKKNRRKYESIAEALSVVDKYEQVNAIMEEGFEGKGNLADVASYVDFNKARRLVEKASKKLNKPVAQADKVLGRLGAETVIASLEEKTKEKNTAEKEVPQQEEVIETAQPRQGLDMVEIERVSQTLEQIVLREDLAVNKDEIKQLAILSVDYQQAANMNSGIRFDKFCENNGLVLTPAMVELYSNFINGKIADVTAQVNFDNDGMSM